jgi:hypothetical protein
VFLEGSVTNISIFCPTALGVLYLRTATLTCSERKRHVVVLNGILSHLLLRNHLPKQQC